jgi:UDPglucose 6-dehydrogenase
MKKQIGWVGLGKCGLPIAEEIGKIHDVLAIDLEFKHLDNAKYTANYSDLADTEMVFVLVQTPHASHLDGSMPVDFDDLRDFDYTAVESVLQSLSDIRYPNIVVISSTVSPGTTARLASDYPLLKLVYMPVMIHIGSVASDYINAPAYIIGATEPDVASQVEEVLRTFVKSQTFLHLTYDEVELYKLMNNVYTSLKILFVNQITEIIEKGEFNASSWNVMDALKTDVKNFSTSRYLTPGSGNGGPCHPRDTIVLGWLADKLGLRSQFSSAIIKSREEQAATLAEYLASFKLPITILGKSFKIGVDLETGSYGVLVGNLATAMGATVYYDISLNQPSAIVLMHPDSSLLDRYPPHPDSVVVDLWKSPGIPNATKIWGINKSAT